MAKNRGIVVGVDLNRDADCLIAIQGFEYCNKASISDMTEWVEKWKHAKNLSSDQRVAIAYLVKGKIKSANMRNLKDRNIKFSNKGQENEVL